MVIAVGALIAALGGTSIAAGPLASDSKSKSISGKRIKARSITRTRIKKNTLTGTEIKESKLGKVPSATSADTAKSADSAKTLAGKALTDFVPATKLPSFGPLELGNGERKDIAKFGAFTFTASCEINIDDGGPPGTLYDRARIFIATSEDNAAFDSFTSGNTDLNPGTAENQRTWAKAEPEHGNPSINESSGVAQAKDGTQVFEPSGYTAVNLNKHADKCQFGGTFIYG
jgi:hypothetical protein